MATAGSPAQKHKGLLELSVLPGLNVFASTYEWLISSMAMECFAFVLC